MMKKLVVALILASLSHNAISALSKSRIETLCRDVTQINQTLATQSLMRDGESAPFLEQYKNEFHLSDDQINQGVEFYKNNPGTARALTRVSIMPGRVFMDNCMASPADHIPNLDKIENSGEDQMFKYSE
ncbi:hypothetical protein [Klebsiella pneumoniae]|uniref:hypothetical protein n=1 Tax=Klebsiella pneumoniae TaxID=573 RepID=UPI00203ECA80|nr:hypothetical protein [Klebsiella pneumoniae]USB65954.1 hypothetical protein KU669_03605 [Klebsiella pneumoniae]